MEFIFLISVILVFIFLITVTFVYIFRPDFLVVKCADPEIIEEVDMWMTFMFALCVALVTMLMFTAIYSHWMYNCKVSASDTPEQYPNTAFEYAINNWKNCGCNTGGCITGKGISRMSGTADCPITESSKGMLRPSTD